MDDPTMQVPDRHAYVASDGGALIFQPWVIDADIHRVVKDIVAAGCITAVSSDRLWILKCAVLQTRGLDGEVWETGVYQGGSALFIKRLIADRPTQLRLFDTFTGLPPGIDGVDLHLRGDFADTSFDAVCRLVGMDALTDFRRGLVPETFAGLENATIRFAHIDLDLYAGIRAALQFVYPRLVVGGMIVLDDYGFLSCPGARLAVDEFFAGKPECPMVMPTGQAVVWRRGEAAPQATSPLSAVRRLFRASGA